VNRHTTEVRICAGCGQPRPVKVTRVRAGRRAEDIAAHYCAACEAERTAKLHEVAARKLRAKAKREAREPTEPAGPFKPRDQLRRRRIEAGLSQAQLAALAGTVQQHIQRIERGHLLQLRAAAAIARALGATLEDLFPDDIAG
jgi:DNA-binding XRE family transcriptional regulator